MSVSVTSTHLRIAILHPDLGIGGAERLVVDAALGLQARGHELHIFTSHHDPARCFEETANGMLRVQVVGGFVPRTIFGAFHSVCAILRQLVLALYLITLTNTPAFVLALFSLKPLPSFDVFLVDQLSFCIPLLRIFLLRRVVFYCHFPDKLLSGGQVPSADAKPPAESAIKRLYRIPIDFQEDITTGAADVLLANSLFTAGVFRKAFPYIRRRPRIVYPGINMSAYDPSGLQDEEAKQIAKMTENCPYLLSLNRFEGKKNVALAIKAFAHYRSQSSTEGSNTRLRLILAGGCDSRIEDHLTTLDSLRVICAKEELSYAIISPQSLDFVVPPPPPNDPSDTDVLFILNFSTAQRQQLLLSKQNLLQLYTPTNEHFGIGPIEAMACGVPVLACASGGPMESITDTDGERTGWLRQPVVEEWSEVIKEALLMGTEERAKLAERARQTVEDKFTMDRMAANFENVFQEAVEMGPVSPRGLDALIAAPFTLAAFIFARTMDYGFDRLSIMTGATFLLVTTFRVGQRERNRVD